MQAINEALLIKKDVLASKHINIIGHYDESTLIDEQGHLIRLFELQGLDYRTLSSVELNNYKNRRNALLKQFDSRFALYHWMCHRPFEDYPESGFKQPYANSLNEHYFEKLKRETLFRTKHYLSLIIKPSSQVIGKFIDIVKRLNFKNEQARFQLECEKDLQLLDEISQRLESAFKEYGIQPLGKIIKNNKSCSESLTFISGLINHEHYSVPYLNVDMRSVLTRHRLFFNSRQGIIQLQRKDGSPIYAAALTIKAYASQTFVGMLDALQSLKIAFTLTQSFRFFDKNAAKGKLKHQQADLIQAQDEALSQTKEITQSLDESVSGEVNYGLHHFVLLCFAKTPKKLQQQVAVLSSVLSHIDLIPVKEDLACELAYWSQLPGNFAYVPREAMISTQNLASFMSFHCEPQGQKENNHWGETVTLLETLSGSPYYFNFHERDIGNTLIFGSMGSGKTLLQGFLLAQSMKFGGKRIVFDKDRGQEILIRALGGHYEVLKAGVPTGFNPCQLENTVENRHFLIDLFRLIFTVEGEKLDETEHLLIVETVARIYAMPKDHRRFRHIAPLFGINKPHSLRSRFDRWHSDGDYAWVFDNENDQLNLNSGLIGFELGTILNDKTCGTPALMYLFHQGSLAMANQRGAIFIDEGWVALNHPYFKNIIHDLGRTPRKKNHFLCLATQVVEDAANTVISKALVESATCKIFFPNPLANRETYIEKLGLSEQAFQWITKNMPQDGFYFLLDYGKGKETVIARVNFSGLEDDIAVLSGRSHTVKLLDSLRSEVGNDPTKWLPLFHFRRSQ